MDERQHSPKLEVSDCVVLTVSQLLLPQYPVVWMASHERRKKLAISLELSPEGIYAAGYPRRDSVLS